METGLSYILFFTDVPRSGYGYTSIPTGYCQISPTLATFFGPYSYLVVDMMQASDGLYSNISSNQVCLGSVIGKTYSGITNVEPPCVLYEEVCDGVTLKVESVFNMLNSLVETIKSVPITTSFRVNYRFNDMLEDYTTSGIFERKQRCTVQSHYIVEPLDLCHLKYVPRPYFREMPWFNFDSLGSKGAGTISSDIQTRMANLIMTLNQTNQRIDATIIDSTVGSATKTQGFVFDVVTLFRVQNCSNAAELNCTTITDTKVDLTTQIFLVGIIWATLTTFLRIPVQVAIYGSWVPVVLFVLAHIVDSSEVYFCIANSFVALTAKYKQHKVIYFISSQC
ncbi:hypothetical protein THRCLA_23023 [Thraustotheca clavata]|uniref:Uncharacterized protein n=1 Tax=Thraustotheca clavata TaxID=74557 RepID=A0A1V9YIM1_9STRA|nr:hypothetical protein THRCLA_23023 [Thraustotheca clavata]